MLSCAFMYSTIQFVSVGVKYVSGFYQSSCEQAIQCSGH